MTAMARHAGVPWPLYRRRWPGKRSDGSWFWRLFWIAFVLAQVVRLLAGIGRDVGR